MSVAEASPGSPASSTSANALELRGVSAGYGRTTILRNVTIDVPAGRVTALLGPNGAGKTTLLRTVGGFLPCTAGAVSLFGDDVTKLAPHKRFARGLCLVPEGRGIFRSLTVRDNLVMQARNGDERDALERAAAAFPVLGERRHQIAGTLSGGQQQMLAMAAAYVREPRLILVDEASLGLAPVMVDQIFAFLHQVTSDGAALLIVDQFATRALEMATTAYVIRRGEVAYAGSASDLLDGDMFGQYLGT